MGVCCLVGELTASVDELHGLLQGLFVALRQANEVPLKIVELFLKGLEVTRVAIVYRLDFLPLRLVGLLGRLESLSGVDHAHGLPHLLLELDVTLYQGERLGGEGYFLRALRASEIFPGETLLD